MKTNACRFITQQQTAGAKRYKIHVLQYLFFHLSWGKVGMLESYARIMR